MDGRLLLVVGLFGVVFFAGVGHSVVTGTDGSFAQVVDESVQMEDADEATPPEEEAGGSGGDGGASADGSSAGAASTSGGSGGGGDGDEASGGGDGGDAAATGPPFRFRIEKMEKCGRTCRDVTATLVNRQDEPAADLVVETRMYAGNDTNDGDRVWKGSEQVGRLAAEADHTSTTRVKLGWGGVLAVKRADGWVTVETTVETADRTVTIERHRDVT